MQQIQESHLQQLNWEFGPIREGDVPQIFANVEKVTSTLQWKAKFTMKEAVKDAWNWEQKQNLRHAK
jgi:UDP-glucose 4-epimerase